MDEDGCTPHHEQPTDCMCQQFVGVAFKNQDAGDRQTATDRRETGANPGGECPFGRQQRPFRCQLFRAPIHVPFFCHSGLTHGFDCHLRRFHTRRRTAFP